MTREFEEPFEDPLKVVRKGYVDSPMGQIHYRTCGEGTPLLMLHMTPQSSLQFQNTFPLLINAGFQVIAPDTPGYGMSDKPKSPPSIEEYSSVFTYVLDSLNIKTTGVVGHHTGASMACELAKSYPDRINKLEKGKNDYLLCMLTYPPKKMVHICSTIGTGYKAELVKKPAWMHATCLLCMHFKQARKNGIATKRLLNMIWKKHSKL